MAIPVLGARGSNVGGVGGGGGRISDVFRSGSVASTEQAGPTLASEFLRSGALGTAAEEEEEQEEGEEEEGETQGRKSRGREEGTTTYREGAGSISPGGREPSTAENVVVVSATNPAVLVRPPRVGDGKLEHDKERRLGVASDLEAVIAVSKSTVRHGRGGMDFFLLFFSGGLCFACRRVRRVVVVYGRKCF